MSQHYHIPLMLPHDRFKLHRVALLHQFERSFMTMRDLSCLAVVLLL